MNRQRIDKIMKQMEETKKLESSIQEILEFHEQQDRIFNSIHGMGCDTYYIVNGYDGSAKIISNTQFETETETRAMAEELHNDIVRHMCNVYGIRDPKVEIKLPVINDPEITINLSTGVHITDVIFNDPATIVFWSDGTKTVVKCCENDIFDKEKGLAMAVCKKVTGNDSKAFHKGIKRWIKPGEESKPEPININKLFASWGEVVNNAINDIVTRNRLKEEKEYEIICPCCSNRINIPSRYEFYKNGGHTCCPKCGLEIHMTSKMPLTPGSKESAELADKILNETDALHHVMPRKINRTAKTDVTRGGKICQPENAEK